MTGDLGSWINSALGQLGNVKFDYNLCQPHRLFKYPEFPLLDKESQDQPDNLIRSLLSPQNPSSIFLYSEFAQALQESLNSFQDTFDTVYTLEPYVPELLELSQKNKFRLLSIPRDPDLWQEFVEKIPQKPQVFFLSHPNYADGFCWPQSFFSKLILEIVKHSPQSLLTIDTRGTLFSLDANPAGRIEPILESGAILNAKVQTLDSIYPVRSPLGPGTSWIHAHTQNTPKPLDRLSDISKNDLVACARSILAFQSRQGPAMAEFQRRILVLQRSLRAFADKLMPLTRGTNPKISIPYWPTQGFYLKIDLNPLDKTTNPNATLDRVYAMARSFSILTLPGTLFGAPHSLVINYALPLNHAEKAADRLGQALNTVL